MDGYTLHSFNQITLLEAKYYLHNYIIKSIDFKLKFPFLIDIGKAV